MTVTTTLQQATVITTLGSGTSLSESITNSTVAVTQSGGSAIVTEMMGPRGTKGDTGNTGPIGPSAYATAVENGFSGTEAQWLESLKGDKGDIGDEGPPGSVPLGGSTGQVLAKASATDSDTEWSTLTIASTGGLQAALDAKRDATAAITLTGNVTGTGTGSFTTTIANSAVTNAKLANVASGTLKGRHSASTGVVEDLTGTQATALLDSFTITAKGLVPAPAATSGKFLKDNGTWAVPIDTDTLPEWGAITGTLSDQADIQAALEAKTAINDSSDVSTTETWSASKISGEITSNINAVIDAAPGALNTLNELAAALGDDPNYATTVTNMVAEKAPIDNPTFTGTVHTAAISATGSITGSNLSGTNTGDQTTISGNAGTATKLATARNIAITGGGITAAAKSFDGSAAITLSATVDSGHITLARMANLAASSFIGNATVSSATPVALTGTQATSLLNTFTTSLKGLVSPPTALTGKFLKDDGTWSTPTDTLPVWGAVTGTLSDQTDLTTYVQGQKPITSTTSRTGYTLVLADAFQRVPATGTVTIPPNSSVAFPIGTIVFVSETSGLAISIAQGAGVVITKEKDNTSGNLTLAATRTVGLLKITTDAWLAFGGGVS